MHPPEARLWQLTEHAAGKHSVQAIFETPAEFQSRLHGLPTPLRSLTLFHVLCTGLGRHGLHTFLFLKAGRHAPQIAETLDVFGLVHPHGLMMQALALFGTDFPVEDKVRAARFGYSSGSGKLNEFDRALLAISAEFGSREAWKAVIARLVARTPSLLEAVQSEAAEVSDDERLMWIAERTGSTLRPGPTFDSIEKQLAALDAPTRRLVLLSKLRCELLNGGVHQYFYNSTGDAAPETVSALLELGLSVQADILAKAVGMFAWPFERDTQVRRREYFHRASGWNPWDETLNRLTDDFWQAESTASGSVQRTLLEIASALGWWEGRAG